MDTRKNAIFVGIIVIAAVTAVFIHSRVGRDPEPVRIGYIGSISGKYAAMGTSARNGAILAMEEINARGGAGKRPVELVIIDDTGDPEGSLEACENLFAQGIRIIIGPFTTASATRVLPYINEQEILMVGPATAGENLAKADDWFLKLYPSTKAIGEKIAQTAGEMGVSTMAVAADHRNKRFCDSMIAGFDSVYKRDGNELKDQVGFFANKIVDYAELAGRVMAQNPDGIFIISSPIDTALLAQNLKKINPKVQLFTSPWAISREVIENGGQAVEGLRFFVPFIAKDKSPGYLDFQKRYRARFGEDPTHVAIFNFEAMALVGQGLEVAKSLRPGAVKDTLINLGRFQGLQSDFTLDVNGDALRRLYLHEIRNQTFTPLPDAP